jgi:hypothetical protein
MWSKLVSGVVVAHCCTWCILVFYIFWHNYRELRVLSTVGVLAPKICLQKHLSISLEWCCFGQIRRHRDTRLKNSFRLNWPWHSCAIYQWNCHFGLFFHHGKGWLKLTLTHMLCACIKRYHCRCLSTKNVIIHHILVLTTWHLCFAYWYINVKMPPVCYFLQAVLSSMWDIQYYLQIQ